MEQDKKSTLRDVFGPWVYITAEPLFKPRHRFIEVLMFVSSGFTCGLAVASTLTSLLPQRGHTAVAGLIVAVACLQVVYFAVEHRRMKAMYEEIQASSKRVREMFEDAPPEAADGPRSVQ